MTHRNFIVLFALCVAPFLQLALRISASGQQSAPIPWVVWLDDATDRVARTAGGQSLGQGWKVETLTMFGGTRGKSLAWSGSDGFAYYDPRDLGGPRPLGNATWVRMLLSAISGAARPQVQIDAALIGRWENEARQSLVLNRDGTASGDGAAYWGVVEGSLLIVDAAPDTNGWRQVRERALSSDRATIADGFRKR